MTHPHDTTDPAADAIRDALHTPDPAAVERIAERIADGAAARAQVRRMPRVRNGRTFLKPALALGVIALAGGVALLAPAHDERGHGVGPKLAAAAVLHDAGAIAADDSWHPLRAGEYHHTETSWRDPFHRTRMTEYRWLAADGTGHTTTVQSSLLPEGTTFWAPATSCDAVYAVGLPDMNPSYVPAGSAVPDCWAKSGLLAGAFGEIVDTPPDGALVDGVDVMNLQVNQDLRFGTTVTEESGPPPGAIENRDSAGNVASVETLDEVTPEAPARTPKATTWVQVRATSTVTFDGPVRGAPTNPVLGALDWRRGIGIAGIEELPTDGAAMYQLLQDRIGDAPQAGFKQGETTFVDASPNARSSMVFMATQLLSEAPTSPQQRAALFDVLAELARQTGAQVEQHVDLPDGKGTATRIRITDEPPATNDPMLTPLATDTDVYLDEETGELRAFALGTHGDPNPWVTSWARSSRVTSIDLPHVTNS